MFLRNNILLQCKDGSLRRGNFLHNVTHENVLVFKEWNPYTFIFQYSSTRPTAYLNDTYFKVLKKFKQPPNLSKHVDKKTIFGSKTKFKIVGK